VNPQRKTKGRNFFFDWGSAPNPGIYRFAARMDCEERGRRRPRPFRPLIGAQVASLRCPILRSGLASVNQPASQRTETYRKNLPAQAPARYN
jgi:hypothetical protein